jgi:phage terminase large subunit GpA-like protein
MRSGASVYAKGFAAGLRPDPALMVSQWADEFRFLSSKASAEPGKYRIDRTPYLREILDSLSPASSVEEVVFMKGAQIGASEGALNFVGYIIHYAPGPAMLVLPTVDMAKRTSKQRLDPMIEECPVIRERVKESRSRDSGNTQLSKEFPGGMLILTGANSATGLRSMPAKYLILDEVDAYPGDVDGEGSPVELAEARTSTFARRKKFKISTPTIKGASAIEVAYEESDQRRYLVPCPHCQHMQELRWGQLKWTKHPDGKPDLQSVHYECASCHEAIQEFHKTWMLANGHWRAANPGAKDGKVAGFHLSALYSPVGWYSWADAVYQWYKAQKNQARLRVFINTVLGETFELRGEDTPEWKDIYARREDYAIGVVPARACLLTAACDVQKDRLEVTLVGWHKREPWVVDHLILLGDTSKDECWAELDTVLERQYPHANGGTIQIRAMLVDSGYNTTKVYEWGRRKDPRRVFILKGHETLSVPIGSPKLVDINYRGKKIPRGVRLWPVGTNLLKGEVYGRLKIDRPTDEELELHGFPERYVHFPMLSEEYFKQLTAEQFMVTQKKSGFSKYEWVKTYSNNEALDCLCYNFAAYYALGAHRYTAQNWQDLADLYPAQKGDQTPAPMPVLEEKRAEIAHPKPQKPRPKPSAQPRRSSFW